MTPSPNDVTASLFLLLRNQQLSSNILVCPNAGRQQSWDYGGKNAKNWTNWQGNAGLMAHLSYSFENPFLSRKAIDAGLLPNSVFDSTFALASDMNPGGIAVTFVSLHSTPAEMKLANSPNHHGNGQNVLYGDGHAEWMNNPLCGSLHDNIFTAGGPENPDTPFKPTTLNVSSTGPQDSILLPTVADLQSATPRADWWPFGR